MKLIILLLLLNFTLLTSSSKCFVKQKRKRHCIENTGYCFGEAIEERIIFYEICPYISNEEELEKQLEIERAANLVSEENRKKSEKRLKQINDDYGTAITSSTSFGYIAGVAITVLLLGPAVVDLIFLIVQVTKKNNLNKNNL
ncbi:hypothetical protein SNEBB_009547 [Seison nebaliae]|nr:hypothetical protein SNEBB_009547 [Seison nebaliae]